MVQNKCVKTVIVDSVKNTSFEPIRGQQLMEIYPASQVIWELSIPLSVYEDAMLDMEIQSLRHV